MRFGVLAHVKVVDLLCKNGAKINYVDIDGYTALNWAVINGKFWNKISIICY